MADGIDEVLKLRSDMSYEQERPEFASAVGGYNRAEVNKFIAEQMANSETMRRVFYEKTNELHDQLSLLTEENKRLRAAMDEIVPIAGLPARDEENGAADQRKLVEQVAGILKARHEAELTMRDDRIAALEKALDDARAEGSKLNVLLGGREAQIDGLNRTLAEKQAEFLAENEKHCAALAEMEKQLEEAKRAHMAALAEKEECIAELVSANEADIARMKEQAEEAKRAHMAALAEKEERIAEFVSANEADIARMREQAEEAERARAAALAEKEERIAELVSANEADIARMKEQAEEAKRAHMAALAEKEERVAELAEAFDTGKKELAGLSDAIEKKNAAIAGFHTELNDMRDNIRGTCAALGAAKEKIASLEEELSLQQGLPSAEELAAKQKEVDALREKLSLKESEVLRSGNEIIRLSSALSDREGELTRLRGAINDIVNIKKLFDEGEPEPSDLNPAEHREKEACKIIAPNFSGGTIR